MTTSMPTILFVDDESSILDGLRRALIDYDDRWTMMFATSAAAALEVMEATPVDVIITDMRMPERDGASLLEEVSRRFPTCARFILSGFSEREAVFRTLGPAHQYFAKPCNTEILVRAIERTSYFRQQLNSKNLLNIVAGTNSIPAMPHALAELINQLQSPNGSTIEVSNIISSDIGLAAHVLKLINSAYFFSSTKVSDVFQAVKLLGFDLIRSVALMAGIFQAFSASSKNLEAIRRLEYRSLKIGNVAKYIAQYEKLDQHLVEQCYCAGMLSHVGTLILYANRTEDMNTLQNEFALSGLDILECEQRLFRTSHQELGGCLLSLWGFSDSIVEAVLCHHRPSAATWQLSDQLGPTAIVHAAQYLVKPRTPDVAEGNGWQKHLDMEYLESIGVANHIDAWVEQSNAVNKEFPG